MSDRRRANATTALVSVGVIAAMLGLTAASVPLYRLFCAVTGYGGTTQRAEEAGPKVLERTVRVSFNGDVDPGLPWRFAPVQQEMTVHVGEQNLAFFRAENVSNRPIVGSAVFNVTPFKVGPYFSKIACFCFTEQTLAAGEAIEMPVSFFVDPAMLDDPDARGVQAITLSYTFYMLEEETRALAGAEAHPGPAS
jgi:cytochrome c oxidase assembly protein subunit 11